MNFTDAVRICFSKYVTFSGRASRPEYWWFFLFLILGSAVAGVLDAMFFGTVSVETEISDTGAQVSAGNENGPIAGLFGLGTFLPSLAVGWRRMHDTGRSGLYLLYPLIVMAGIGIFAGLTGSLNALIPGAEGTVTPLAGFSMVVLAIAAIVFLISPLLVLWWLTRPSQPGTNEYGPNPHEGMS